VSHILDFKDKDFSKLTVDERIDFALSEGTREQGMRIEDLLALEIALLKAQVENFTVVETGMRSGISTRFILPFVLANNGKFYSVERYIDNILKEFMQQLNLWGRITVIESDSRAVILPEDTQISYLNIDSGHHQSLVLSEYLHFRQYFQPEKQ
jgi:hypothetical protein